MDESEQRRERLKAMRMEASQEATTYNDGSSHSAVSLSNPLLESTANNDNQVQPFAQSFNYYTDPMAAYSGNKQRSKVSPQISHDYSSTSERPQINEMFPSPSLQPRINYSPNPQMQQPQGQFANPSYACTPNRPQGGFLPSPSWDNNSPHPGGYRGPGQGYYPSPIRGPNPHFNNHPGHGSGRGYTSPHFNNSPGHGSGRGYPSPRPNHGRGPGGYPSSGPYQGRGNWLGDNMNLGPSSGRGRGRSSGQSGGRGRGQGRGGAHNHVTAEDRPDIFFNRSMMEDPWKFLEPVIWKSYKKQWFPHSVGAKKPKVSESPKQSSSQPSLAEMLAASFNEAAKDEHNAE